ncbi:hypothetical protein [Sphingomonas sp. Leaf357]|uniref:hypothetical protein n=1 Tax=Sphingomonas sp. Leaf357 TaxID=1736350 RepID=UPI001F2B302C|nr:hypothetical protein [Sphingomonas sp. Leaf357]
MIAALPLFEEANRTRAFMVSILRALAQREIGSILPDLPGTGESLTPLESMTIQRMQGAYEDLVSATDREGRRAYGIGIRSGALLDTLGPLSGRWHFAPQSGEDLLRELTRVKQAELGIAKPLREMWFLDGSRTSAEIAGNSISADLLSTLAVEAYVVAPGTSRRTVRLMSDPKPADVRVDAAPLWRRSEPDNDIALAECLANDIADWIATCES